MAPSPEDIQATFCATLVDEWVRDGVRHAVVCPGSRSTPLTLALAADGRLEVHVHQDERSGGFLALGLGLATGEPAVVVTTSGTAAVELHPAVVEADLAGVPLLVCTADRPPELIGVGAPQAIDQTHLYGGSVRWFHSPGVADAAAANRWRASAARAYAEATGPMPGPVHLNLAFREPLVGAAGGLPEGRGDGGAWAWRPVDDVAGPPVLGLTEDLAGRRGLIVAGPGSGSGDDVSRLAAGLGWPVLAAPQAEVWGAPEVVPAVDALLRAEPDLMPQVVLRLGGPLASRVVGEWIARTGAPEIVVAGPHAWSDPHGTAAVVLPVSPGAVLAAWLADVDQVAPVDDGAWLTAWQEAGRRAEAVMAEVLAAESALTEPGVARALVAAIPAGTRVVVSSSMPIRDVEWFASPRRDIEVLANRGANGIDGVVSTAVGIGLGDRTRPTVLLVGDLAFLHDTNGLLGAAGRGIDLVILVVDNDGGGIFSFLPQASALDGGDFERLFGTPHGLDVVALAAAYGVPAQSVGAVEPHLSAALAEGGVHVLVARTDRSTNVALHDRLHAAVAALPASGHGEASTPR